MGWQQAVGLRNSQLVEAVRHNNHRLTMVGSRGFNCSLLRSIALQIGLQYDRIAVGQVGTAFRGCRIAMLCVIGSIGDDVPGRRRGPTVCSTVLQGSTFPASLAETLNCNKTSVLLGIVPRATGATEDDRSVP
jgi:hypothetical protein